MSEFTQAENRALNRLWFFRVFDQLPIKERTKVGSISIQRQYHESTTTLDRMHLKVRRYPFSFAHLIELTEQFFFFFFF